MALFKRAPARYPIGKAQKDRRVGAHKPVPMLDLVDYVCVQSYSLTSIGVLHGWTSQRGDRMAVPDRQRKCLAAALRVGLEAVIDKWTERGLRWPASLATIDVE